MSDRPSDYIYRAARALVAGKVRPGGEKQYLKAREAAGDKTTGLIVRAASTGFSLANAGPLVQTAVVDFLASLGPVSAGAQLIAKSFNLASSGNGMHGATLPGMIPSSAAGAFIAEGKPIPVEMFVVTGPTILPKKMAMISCLTREMAQSSNADKLIRMVMRDSAALTLDANLFSAAAATGAAPAGLLNGVAPLAAATPATAEGADRAMRQDLANLAVAVAPIAGAQIAYVASPGVAVKVAMGAPTLPYPVFATAALPEGSIAAIATNSLVVAANPEPSILVSSDAVVHMDDNTPVPIGTVGFPNAVAGKVTSLFQTEQVAIRLILDINWAFRAAGSIAVINGVSW